MTKNNKKKIIIFADFYSPGYLAGGALRSIFNAVSLLDSKFDFTILTRGYDVFPKYKYSEKIINKLINTNNSKVIYSYKKFLPDFFVLLINLINNKLHTKKFDFIYLNSFFSPFAAILPLFFVLIGFLKCNKIIIAPRGELNVEGLSERRIKKRIYLFIFKKLKFLIRNYKIYFHASNHIESDQIRKIFKDSKIKECIDPPAKIRPIISSYKPSSSSLKIVFFSRISYKKNLKFLIKCFINTNFSYQVDLDIIGPICDKKYWIECKKLVHDLPQNVRFNYLGNFSPNKIYREVPKYDLFVFPTLGENFGHVIFESIRLGTPVLTTPFTPWSKEKGVIKTLPLNNYEKWIIEIDKFFRIDKKQRLKFSKKISYSVLKSNLLKNIKKQHYNLFSD